MISLIRLMRKAKTAGIIAATGLLAIS